MLPKSTLEITDLNCYTTVEEDTSGIRVALKSNESEVNVTLKMPNIRGQMAIVELASKKANMLVTSRKVKIGWINCKIRE